MSGKVKCTCGWSWDKKDSSKKDMYVCHECGKDNSMKNGGWLSKYAEDGVEAKKKPESLLNLTDLTYTPMELNFLNDVKNGYCPTGNCLESSRKAYDMTAGRIKGISGSNDIWTKDLNLISTPGRPSEKQVQENPYFKGDIKSGSADSWDIHGAIVKAGGKNIYSGASKQIVPTDIPTGAVAGWGPAVTKGTTHKERGQGMNTQFGLQPSHHSTESVGYDDNGKAIFYDSYTRKYGTLEEIGKELKSKLGYELENISVPKSVAGNTRENLNKKGILKNELTPFSANVDKLLSATKQPWAQINEDGKSRSPNADKEKLSKFAQSLTDNKGELISSLGLSNADYDRLANSALAIAMTESEGGGALGFSDRFGNTKGMTQLNIDNIKKDDRLKTALSKKYKGDGAIWNIQDPYNSAIATMMYLSVADKDAKRLYNKGLTPGIKTVNQPGLIENFRSTNSKLNKDGLFIDELNKRVPYSEIPGYEDGDTTKVNNYLKQLTKSDRYSFVNKDGDLSLKLKTKGNNPKLTDVEKIAYMWQSPNSLKTGDAEGKSQYVNKIKNYYDALTKFNDGGPIQPNYNDADAFYSEDYVGAGYDIIGRDYSPAWGGQFEHGGTVPGSVGFSYARTKGIPSNGPYAKKTLASAQDGKEISYDQWKKQYKLKETPDYNLKRAWELGYTPDKTGHLPTVDNQTGQFLKSKGHPTLKLELDWYNSPEGAEFKSKNTLDSTGKFFKYIPKLQNGKEMQFYQNGLDWKPKSISRDGSVIEDDRGQWDHPGEITKINSNEITMQGVDYPVLGVSDTGDTQMMQPGEDYTYDGNSVTEYPMMKDGGWLSKYAEGGIINDVSTTTDTTTEFTYIGGQLKEVVVQDTPSEFGKLRQSIEQSIPWDEYATKKYLNNFAKSTGQSLENIPEYRKKEYEDYINKLAFDKYIETHPKVKGEKRGDYIDRIQNENLRSEQFSKAYENNAEYNPSTDESVWHKSLMGLSKLVSPALTDQNKQLGHYYSTKEKQNMIDSPISTGLGDVLGTIAPLEIPGNMVYGQNNNWLDALEGRGTDVPMEARLFADPLLLAFEAAPLMGAGLKAIKNTKAFERATDIGSNIINKGVSASKQISKDLYGLATGERSATRKQLDNAYKQTDAVYSSPEYLGSYELERNLAEAEDALRSKAMSQKGTDWERFHKIYNRESDIHKSKSFTLNNEGLVQSNKDTSLGLRTGSSDIVDLATGERHSISANVPNESIRFDLKGNEVVKSDASLSQSQITPKYTETVKKNIDFIENQIPGAKVFGSAKNVAETNVPHLVGDYDVLMSQSEYNKFAKGNPKVSDNGFAKVHNIPGSAKGIEPIDINVIEEVNGKASGDRAKELFRQVAPDEFYKAAKTAIKNKSELEIPYSSKELVDMTNPTTKSIVDAYESVKPKHLNKIDALINYGKPSVVLEGQQQYVKGLVGNKGSLGHQFSLDQLSDVNKNEEILNEIGFIGNKKLAAADPERMQLALNDYYMNQTILVRQVNKGPVDKIENAIKVYSPEAGGGNANGIGQNHVTLGFPYHGDDNITSVKQIGLDLNTEDPLAYVGSIKHQTSAEKLFNDDEQKLLSDIVDKMNKKSFRNEGVIDLRKNTGGTKEQIKNSKNVSELISTLPYSDEGKVALYDFAKQTGRHIAKKDRIYGSSNFSVTLRDFDEAIDAMQYTASNQVEMNKTLKSYNDRLRSAEYNSSSKNDLTEQLLPKEFKLIKGYLKGGLERAEQRLAYLKKERDSVNDYQATIVKKTYGKLYKEDIDRVKAMKEKIATQINELDKQKIALRQRADHLDNFKTEFKNFLLISGAAGTVGGLTQINDLSSYMQSRSGKKYKLKYEKMLNDGAAEQDRKTKKMKKDIDEFYYSRPEYDNSVKPKMNNGGWLNKYN